GGGGGAGGGAPGPGGGGRGGRISMPPTPGGGSRGKKRPGSWGAARRGRSSATAVASATTARDSASRPRRVIVAPLARDGSGRQVARLRLAPGAPRSSPSLARSLLHRSLATAPGARSLGCASLRGRLDPRRRSLAH